VILEESRQRGFPKGSLRMRIWEKSLPRKLGAIFVKQQDTSLCLSPGRRKDFWTQTPMSVSPVKWFRIPLAISSYVTNLRLLRATFQNRTTDLSLKLLA
jgi:hypothetical protein